MLPADLFAGPGKIVLSGMLFALVQPFEVFIVFGSDSAHAPNTQTDHQSNHCKGVNHPARLSMPNVLTIDLQLRLISAYWLIFAKKGNCSFC